MAIAQINSIDIPYVFAVQVDWELVADRARTAGGKLRQDAVAMKRAWVLETQPMTLVESDLITDEIDTELGGPVEFWLDEFGATSVTVTCFVEIEQEERVAFARSGIWHNDGRQLSLRFIEQ